MMAVEPYREAWSAGYAANGQQPVSPALQPALIDRKG